MTHLVYWNQLLLRAAVRLACLTAVILLVPVLAFSGKAEAAAGDGELAELYSRLLQGYKEHQPLPPEPSARPTVYLTFDDGPSGLTPQVLDLLKAEGIPATFFVLGQMAERYPDTVARIVEEGHSLGNHTYNHVYKELYNNFDAFWEQTVDTERILQELTGQRPSLLRAPGGTYTNFDAFYYYYLQEAGYQVVDWNVDSGDSKRRGVPAAEIVANVKQSPLHSELIVLMHDGKGHEETVKALPEIIAYYKEQGYTFASLTEENQPVQFRIGPLKWKRNTGYDQFVRQLGQVREHNSKVVASAHSEQEQAGNKQAESGLIDKDYAHDKRQESESLPLTITWDGEPVVLNSGQYQFDNGRFAVPLTELAASWDAELEWDEVTGEAVIRSGLREAAIDPNGGIIRWTNLSESKVYHMADVQRIDGEIYVGLRMMAELFDYRIVDYTLEPDDRTVHIESNKSLGFPWKRSPDASLSQSKL